MQGKLFVLTGPSGVGKTTVATKLLSNLPNLKKVVTCTTRQPRDGEIDGRDYNFLSEQEFRQMINSGEMFEWAEVYEKLYGNRIKDLENIIDQGENALLVIDVQGAATVAKIRPEAITIFLTAESPALLLGRIEKRGKIENEDLEKRLAAVEEEMLFAKQANFIVENKENSLEATVAKIQEIIEEYT